jgi:hypothetical protein
MSCFKILLRTASNDIFKPVKLEKKFFNGRVLRIFFFLPLDCCQKQSTFNGSNICFVDNLLSVSMFCRYRTAFVLMLMIIFGQAIYYIVVHQINRQDRYVPTVGNNNIYSSRQLASSDRKSVVIHVSLFISDKVISYIDS